MVRQCIYPKRVLPAALQLQILSSLRQSWPNGSIGPAQMREWMLHQEHHPIHIVLLQGSLLISHTTVVWKYLCHAGETYQVYGLSGVFTHPAWRGQGHGSRIVEAGTAFIAAAGADVGMLWCAPSLQDFYMRWGWLAMDTTTTLIGPAAAPRPCPLLLMMLFPSPAGRAARHLFENCALWFGEQVW